MCIRDSVGDVLTEDEAKIYVHTLPKKAYSVYKLGTSLQTRFYRFLLEGYVIEVMGGSLLVTECIKRDTWEEQNGPFIE